MPRIVQTLAFFALLGAELLATAPSSGGGESFSVLLSGSIIAATIAYVLPWVFELDTTPATTSESE